MIVNAADICKNYQLGKTVVPALRGVNLVVNEGEFVSVAGASGSGKTTLLNLIGCLDRPTSGALSVGGKQIDRLPDSQLNQIRSKTIGFIFQSFNLISVLSARENIELPLLIHRDVNARERNKRVDFFIDAAGLGDLSEN